MSRISIGVILLTVEFFAAGTPALGQPLLRRLEERLREGIAPRVAPPRPSTASASGPVRLGVVVNEVSREAISAFGLVVRRGALVTSVEPNSAADRAGLKPGALIVAVDGERVDSPDELVAIVRAKRAGQAIEIAFYQGPRLNRKQVQLTPSVSRPEPLPLELPPPASVERADGGTTTGRPLLDRLGGVLDGLASPASGAVPVPAESAPPQAEQELKTLRDQIEALQSQVRDLTKRLAELEKRLAE